jgi:hypothetical protein
LKRMGIRISVWCRPRSLHKECSIRDKTSLARRRLMLRVILQHLPRVEESLRRSHAVNLYPYVDLQIYFFPSQFTETENWFVQICWTKLSFLVP